MRVISGTNKGQRLLAPKGKKTRPTEDRIKESIFNILMPIKGNSIMLDIFSGSGQIGIEFLSRGAEKVIFVDYSKESISIINENLERTRLKDKGLVIKSDYSKALDHCMENKIFFDYIYIDPPFSEIKLFNKTIEQIYTNNLLKDDGILIVEHQNDMEFNDIYDFSLMDNRKYGNVDLSIFYNNKR